MELVQHFAWFFYGILSLQAVLLIFCLIRAGKGPRIADRLVAVSNGYADRICIPSATVYFGLPAIEGFRLSEVTVGQSRRGSADNAETKITTVGIMDSIPEEEGAEKTYVSGGELQDWPGWAGKKDKTVVDHTFSLTGTKGNTVYYLNSDNASIGLYFSRLVLTYEKL